MEERLYKKLESYGRSDFYPFHMPGHKRNPLAVDGDFPVERDITEINGFDNLHHAEDLLKRAQEDVARLYGVPESFYSINGSSGAILAAVSAAVGKGGQILIARNCHKAVYHAIYLRDLGATYIYPHEDPRLGINGGISPSRVEMYLAENPEIEAVLITSPTYDGIVSDVARIADVVHNHGIPLIVDEAHGAHFHFSDYFPVSAAELGADVVINSVHKTLPCLTQTGVIHLCSDRVSREKLMRFLGIYQSSSPSYILMSSIDACMDKLEREGDEMFRVFTENLEKARERLGKCKYIRLVTPQACECQRVFDFDRSKLLLSTVDSSLNGRQLHQILREEFHLEMEMEAENYVLALAAVGDTAEGFERLCEAVEEIDRRESLKYRKEVVEQEPVKNGKMKQMMRISEAMDAENERYPLAECIGRTSAEFAYLYPPGIPLIVPGEQISGHFVKNVRRYLEQGCEVQGLSDQTSETVCVVKNE